MNTHIESAFTGVLLLLIGWATLSMGIGLLFVAAGVVVLFRDLPLLRVVTTLRQLRERGVKPVEQPVPLHTRLRCPYCNALNPIGIGRCPSCGAPA
jgi:hypothetical protein